MDSGRINRGEKLSTLKLTVVQYGILLMMLALAAGLWRLQVLGADNYRLLSRAEPHSQRAGDGRPRQALRPRRPAAGGQLPLGLLLSGPRAGP
jgi:hypothetical protein